MVDIDKVKALIKLKGLTITQVCAEMGEAPSYLDKVKKGLRRLDETRVEYLAQRLNTSPKSLMEGSNYLLQNTFYTPIPRAPESSISRIPILDKVAAGEPILAEECFDADDPDMWELVTADEIAGGEFFALRIHGDSMTPYIKDNAVVIVRKQEIAEEGDTVIATINGNEGTCKIFHKDESGVTLIPYNPMYPKMRYTKEDVKEFPLRIVGIVEHIHQKSNKFDTNVWL